MVYYIHNIKKGNATMTKQKNGNWKITEDEMRDIMICFFEGIQNLENLGCYSLADMYSDMYREYCKEDEKGC